MPADGLWDGDGVRLQSWLKRGFEIRSRSNPEGFIRDELGLVTARYYKDEEGNQGGIFTEYDVYVPRHQIVLNNLPMKVLYQGIAGGIQATLKVAEGIPDASNSEDLWRQVLESDGDLVSVSFVGGKWPMIDGCMNHVRASGAADWQTDSADGEVYALSYNTTRSRVNSDGNIEIDLEDGGDHDRSVIINVSGTQVLKVAQDGSTGDVRIELGNGGEKVILGETFQTWFNINFASHGHNAGTLNVTMALPTVVVPVVGVTDGPIPIGTPFPPAPLAKIEMPATNLTDKVLVEG